MENLKLQNMIGDSTKQANDNLSIKVTELTKMIKKAETALNSQIGNFNELPEKFEKVLKDVENQDTYLFEVAERTEKLENELRELKEELKNGDYAGGGGGGGGHNYHPGALPSQPSVAPGFTEAHLVTMSKQTSSQQVHLN